MEILENKDVSIVFSVCLKAIGLFKVIPSIEFVQDNRLLR